ncbi:MAG: choice-of-anchor I family protein [Verrucomicrobia bacterium]|nr:choice-of-anchor I family protein [Verrucomicrobiota bacterium]
MKRAPLNLTLTLASLLMAMNAEAFTLLDSYNTGVGLARNGSAEILAYTAHDNYTVLSTVGDNTGGSFGVQILSLSNTGTLSEKGFADFSSVFGAAGNWNGASSVAVDPNNRGFGAVSLIPSASTTTAGKVAFFDYRGSTANNARNLVVLDVGFHPDSVKFSADGTKLLVANEGENIIGTPNSAGSLSIIDLSSISNIGNVSSLTNSNVATFDFQATNLGASASLAGVRNASIAAIGNAGETFIGAVPDFNVLGGTGVGSDPDFYKGIEPEFISQSGNKLYVTLQENNAVGVFDLGSNKWEKIHKLGAITQTIDASDQDGSTALLNDTVKGLPMPDSIATYSVAGQTYFITANEGDARPEDPSRDLSRFGDTSGVDSMNPILDSTVYPTTATGVRANAVLGRLNVSRLDGDNGANGGTAGDGKIDDITMIGTRSFSIWNADTGALVWDSGSGNSNAADGSINAATNMESLLLGLDPTYHNMNNGTPGADARSDDKGPEPEALTIGQFGSDMYAFIGMERQNGLMVYNITNPNSPYFVGYTNALGESLVSPEGMVFVAAADSPTGTALLLTGYEGVGSEATRGISVHAVPEPSRALLSLVGLALIALRRRRA